MFGGAKQTFGAAAATPAFGFSGAAAASPFGAQSSFGKPANAGFGQAPAFGQQQNTSLFGAPQPAAGGLFGATATPSFGAPAAVPQQTGFSGELVLWQFIVIIVMSFVKCAHYKLIRHNIHVY